MLSLIDIIESSPKQTAYGYEIIGTIIDEISPPPPIDTLVLIEQDSCFAIMDVVAIKGKSGVVKWTRGFVAVIVPRELVRDAKTKPSKRLAVGVSGGRLQYGLNNNTLVTMYKFKQINDNGSTVWGLETLQTRPLTKSTDAQVIRLLSTGLQNGWNYIFPEPTPDGFLLASPTIELQTPSGYFIKGGLYSNRPLTPPVNMDEVLRYARTNAVEKPQSRHTSGNQTIYTQPTQSVAQNTTQPTEQPQTPMQIVPPQLESKGLFSDNFGGLNTMGVIVDETQQENGIGTRFDPIPMSKDAEIVYNQIKDGLEKREMLVSALEKEDTSANVRDMMLANIIRGFKENWNTPILYMTGKQIFQRILDNFDVTPKKGMTIKDMLESDYNNLIDSLHEPPDNTDIYSIINEHREAWLFGVVEFALKIQHNRLVSTYLIFRKNNLSFFDTIQHTPFTLGFINPRLTIEDIEKLRRLFNLPVKDEAKNMRDVAYVTSIMLNPDNLAISSSTLIEENKLKRILVSGIPLSKQTTPMVRSKGCYIDDEQELFIQKYIHSAIKSNFFMITDENIQLKGRDYVLSDGRMVDTVIENYLKSGQGIRLEIKGRSYIGDLSLLAREIELLRKFDRMNKDKLSTIPQQKIDQCVTDFEEMKTKELGFDFKLEEAQKDVLKLLQYRAVILTGPAGSGKTTVAELLLFALKRFYGLNEDDIIFVAPTGKAAVRLKETTKANTSTIHSYFGLGIDNQRLKWGDHTEISGIEATVGDEYSMVNINVAYDSLMQLPDKSFIVFLGDIAQLPPIGFGKPLYDFLQYLPCVMLNVTKRASEGSMITKNADRLRQKDNREELQNGEDFKILETLNVQEGIQHMRDILKHHVLGIPTLQDAVSTLGTISPDDFQVISPYSNAGDYNTKVLNREIQELINPYKSKSVLVTIQDEEFEFRLGDRVIHDRKNNKDQPHYIHLGGNVYREASTTGVFNGDIGKIKSFHLTRELINEADKTVPLSEEVEFAKENDITIAVEYQGIDDKGDVKTYTIFYHTSIITDNGRHFITMIKDLANIKLAYALTVHKLQGSQAKLTITLLITQRITSFISMNLLYTAITRTQKGGYFIGNVRGRNSAVNQARKINALDERTTLISALYGN